MSRRWCSLCRRNYVVRRRERKRDIEGETRKKNEEKRKKEGKSKKLRKREEDRDARA